MSITVNIRYKGENGAAKKFAEDMIKSGTKPLWNLEKSMIFI